MLIATRELTAVDKSGERKPVLLRIEMPVEQDGSWDCWYEIVWPEDDEPARTRRFHAGGEDAMQALQPAMMLLGIDVHTDRFNRDHKLLWNGADGCGLIVPASLRDRLRGDVATYYGDS